MKIITISREFGSGGRILGEAIAEHLGFDYYDREIISAIAKNQELEEAFVSNIMEQSLRKTINRKFRATLDSQNIAEISHQDLLMEEQRVLEEIAAKGKDCVIVGRHAEFRLQKFNPYRIFVCADMDARINNCLYYQQTNGAETIKQIAKNIQKVDKIRSHNSFVVTGNEWGDPSNYDLVVNTTNWKEIEEMAPAIAGVALKWFESHDL